ncbi:MAG TPA: C1 family peptidase, partial [Polyangiaceae bacterium]
MRLSSLSCGIIGLFAAGCSDAPAGSNDSPEIGKQASALTPAPPAGNVRSRGPRLGELDPNSPRRAKGARLATRTEAAERAARTPRLIEVKPSALALERIAVQPIGADAAASESEALAVPPAAAGARAADPVTVARSAQSGSDLVLVAPSSVASSATSSTSPATYAATMATGLPTSVDNSKEKSFPEIRNQGGLNSCEAFAIGYYQATYEIGRLAGWDNKSASSTNATKISPKWFYNMNNRGANEGTSNGQHYDLLVESGALTWADFPYDGDPNNSLNFRQWPLGTTLWSKALRFKGLSYTSVMAPTDAASMQTVKSLLVNGRVLTFDTNIDPWRFDHLDNDPSTSLDDAFANQWVATWLDGSTPGGGHAMTIVGYDDNVWIDLDNDNRVDAAEKGAFKIANSWGQDWDHGNAGFVWLSYDALGVTSQILDPALQPDRMQPMYSLNTVIVRSNYQPNLTAEFTLNMLDRNESMSVSVSEPDKADSFINWFPRAFSQGGAYAFDGTARTTPMSATFVLDLTEVAPSYGDSKYGLTLSNFGAGVAKLSGLTFVDRLKNNLRTVSTDPAPTITPDNRGGQTLRYRYQDPAHVPQLAFTPSTTVGFGNVGLGSSAMQLLS